MFEGNSTLHDAWKAGNGGGSSVGQGYTSSLQHLAHNQGARDRAAAAEAASAARSAPPAIITTSAYPTYTSTASAGSDSASGGILGGRRPYANGLTVGSIVINLLFWPALFGAYDNIVNLASDQHSSDFVIEKVNKVSLGLGRLIRSMDPESDWLSMAADAQHIVAVVASEGMGFAAGIGNDVAGAVRGELQKASAGRQGGIHYATVATLGLNIRPCPGLDCDPINSDALLPQGLTVKIVGPAQGDWSEIKASLNGRMYHGFVKSSLLAPGD